MESYKQAIALLKAASSENGFLASKQDITNYKRVWARDGVICGLAALLDGDKKLVNTFKCTLITLRENQHKLGNIPSNIFFDDDEVKISYGGLAGRVDTVSWFIIGCCNYAYKTGDRDFLNDSKSQIFKGLELLECWEYNNNDLVYVPKSGNWADEYITEGYILYDQLLRVWALRCVNEFFPKKDISEKITKITDKIESNYRKLETVKNPYHPKAYNSLKKKNYWMASISPSGYQKMYDGFANSLALLLNLGGEEFQMNLISYSEKIRKDLPLNLVPAFWPPIFKEDANWYLLENNCKYEFRNYPYEFHNGGTWQVVNGFYGAALVTKNKNDDAREVLQAINVQNKVKDWGFYENFNSKTKEPNGVKYCTWSAASSIILAQYLKGNNFLI